jgi:hypothetical protein
MLILTFVLVIVIICFLRAMTALRTENAELRSTIESSERALAKEITAKAKASRDKIIRNLKATTASTT